jgi:branched-chain amino acid transport system ATP-binding protein
LGKNIVEIKNLSVSYGSIEALKDISIHVKNGECVAIVGSNGAGKSTLLKTVMGFIRQKSGSILFDGKNIDELPTHKRSSIGLSFVPEGARVFQKISVFGNLMLGAYKEKDKELIQKRMDYVYTLFPRLQERKKQLAGTLSGGERQMLAMARALMGKPQLLMIDEISLGLMPKLVDSVFEIVDELHKNGTTILLSEQNAHKAAEVADRIYILELGRIAKETDKEGLLNDEDIRRAYLGK